MQPGGGEPVRLLRIGALVVSVAALAVTAYLAAATLYFVVRSQEVPGTVVSREKVGFRSWEVAVEYPAGPGRTGLLRVRGYYNGAAHAPGATVAVRFAGDEARLGAGEDLWLRPLFTGFLGGLLLWLSFMIKPLEQRRRAGPETDRCS